MALTDHRPPRLPPGPQSAKMSACEVLTWIALGRAQTKEALNADSLARDERWGEGELIGVQVALEGRASRTPFCAVYRLRPDGGTGSKDMNNYAHPLLSPNGPRKLRGIRGRARRRLRTLVDYRTLAAMVLEERLLHDREDVLIASAAREVMEALVAEKITAHGQPSRPDGNHDRSARHGPVPWDALVHSSVKIDIWNQIGTSRGDGHVWQQRKELTYHEVYFKTAEVLALWPEQPAPPAVALDDLPAAWSLLECVAWIMLRNTDVVRDAAEETARPGAEYRTRHELPNGQIVTTLQTGAGGNGRERLDILAAWEMTLNPAADVCASAEAEAALLAALRSGKVEAHGTPSTGTPRVMQPRDWRGLRLVEAGGSQLAAADTAPGGIGWHDVTIGWEQIAATWAPRMGKVIAAPIKSAPSVDHVTVQRPHRMPFSETLLRTLYTARVARWLGAQVVARVSFRPPSPDDDAAWADGEFDRVPRPALRRVRAACAPASWKKKGPKTGMKLRD